MARIKNLVGQRFNRLLVVRDSGIRCKSNRQVKWECLCDCGNTAYVDSSCLTRQKSCGCANKDRATNPRHGHTVGGKASLTYSSWSSMVQRCTNPKNHKYKDYGARGISVHDSWRYSFDTFLLDMGNRPKGTTIERVDVNLGYEPGNCVWGTPKQQANNKRNNRIISYMGKEMTASQWADYLGIPFTRLRMRLHRGWSLEKALC